MGVIGAKSLFCESQQGRPGGHTEQRRHTVGQACPLPLKEHGPSGNTRGSHALLEGAGHLESVREEAPQIYLTTSKPHTCLPILTVLSTSLVPDFSQPIHRPLTASAPPNPYRAPSFSPSCSFAWLAGAGMLGSCAERPNILPAGVPWTHITTELTH